MSHICDLLPDIWEEFEDNLNNPGKLQGISTGFYDLDAYTSGLQKSSLIVLGSRPSMGKTSLALNLTAHIAIRESKPVLYFSFDTDKEQLTKQLLSSESEIYSQKLQTGEFGEHEFPRLTQAMGRLGDTRLHIFDEPRMTCETILETIREWYAEYKGEIGLVVIDYLQFLKYGEGYQGDNRAQEISVITRELKLLARELQIPILLLCQLSRTVESRFDKRPLLSDLKDSGSIEEDADLVMFLYRDEFYNKETDRPGCADIIIAKQRSGPIGEVNLLFRNALTRFLNPADRKTQIF